MPTAYLVAEFAVEEASKTLILLRAGTAAWAAGHLATLVDELLDQVHIVIDSFRRCTLGRTFT
jgi:hypothetical protein